MVLFKKKSEKRNFQQIKKSGAKPLKRREFLIFIFLGIILISSILVFTYFIYDPYESGDLPRICITCSDELSYNEYVECSFEIRSNQIEDQVKPMNSRIKYRGSGNEGGSRRWPKKGYRLELSQDISLLNMRKDDDWVLFSMYLDFSRTRIKLGLDSWASLNELNPTAFSPESEYVTLYFNGEFQGLYLLAEKTDRRLFNLNEPSNDNKTSLIFQADVGSTLREYHQSTWHQDWPNEYEGYRVMDDIMNYIVRFINCVDNNTFFSLTNGIFSLFEKSNLIDFYLYNYFNMHLDFWSNNYFIIRNSYPNKFFLIPWDYDKSFGQYGWERYAAAKDQQKDICNQSQLFNRLLQNSSFLKECKDRWFYLRRSLWTQEYFIEKLEEYEERIKYILEFEVKMWNPKTIKLKYENDLDESTESLHDWIKERLIFCDNYFAKY
ncbi:MAG: hypothetical protein GF383_13095 [Candidatus Lokiarchaeota archaeon]|nr:hypothetical protein [Candidatus Lokiarchaeota archaeon]